MNALRDGWFTELGTMWPGQSFSLKVSKVLYEKRTKFQDLIIFDSESYGRVMILDGVIQLTERDEFAYHEMMAHVPMFSHKKAEHVLVIGGGDGGVVRELLKHKSVKTITICDIDGEVIEQAKKFFPNIAGGLTNDKVTVHVGDGLEFLKAHSNKYDVIITDSSDPVGPAECLFQQEYFKLLHNALKDDGLLLSQGECMWLHLKLIKEVTDFCKSIFPVVDYNYIMIGTYPSGQIGTILCSKDASTNFRQPHNVPSKAMLAEHANNLKYYTPQIHESSFQLPAFAHRALHQTEAASDAGSGDHGEKE